MLFVGVVHAFCIDFFSVDSQIITELEMMRHEHNFGRSKIFIRSPASLFALEGKRAAKTEWLCARIQAMFRGFVQRRRYKAMKLAQIVIAAKFRAFVAASFFPPQLITQTTNTLTQGGFF